MSLLNSKFNLRRGFPFGTAMDETFTPAPGLTPVLGEGDFIVINSSKQAVRVASVDHSGAASAAALATLLAAKPQIWMVISGNEAGQYDTLRQTWVGDSLAWTPAQIVALRGAFQVTTEKYVTRAYVTGDKLCVIAGELDLTNGSTNTGHVSVGTVISYDSTAGTLTADIQI